MSLKRKAQQDDPCDKLSKTMRREVTTLLRGGHSHAKFERVVDKFPVQLRGTIPDGLPYSAWQVLEHMRIAQRYMLDYTREHLASHARIPLKKLRRPTDYWVKQATPPHEDAWDKSVRTILEERSEFEAMFNEATDDSLITPSAPRYRKTMLRLALQIADHNAYHTGQLVILRRLLRSWAK
jgi:DinB superfamily